MEKLKKFNLEDDYLEIKESLEYPCVSLTDDNGKLWVKEKPISYIVAKYYISEENVNKDIYLFTNYYFDFNHMINYYITDEGLKVERYENVYDGINQDCKFNTPGEHTVIFYIDNSIMDLDNIVINLNNAFNNVKKLISIDFSHFLESSHVNSMNSMFNYCINLTSVTFGDNFDTSNVTNMDSMFRDCDSLTSLDLSSFDTSNVTEMSFMFNGCFKLTSLDLSGWDISKVNDGWCAFGFGNNDAVIGVDPTLDVFNCMPI